MQTQFKTIDSKVGYRVNQIVFSEDGSCNTTVQIVVLKTIPATETQPESVGYSILASQGQYLTKDEVDAIVVDPEEIGGKISLRDLIDAKLELVLKAKGLIPL